MLYIFDLDGTTVDSAHRLGRGSLESWKRNNTPENIAKDGLLPLAELVRLVNEKRPNDMTVVCTSRVMGVADYEFVTKKLNPVGILCRKEGDERPCGELKRDLLEKFGESIFNWTWEELTRNAVMWDDSDDVIDTLSNDGLTVIDARKYQ